ncbi:hypothetical protein IP510_12005 [Psychrobacter sp. NG254]|uniref:hypothetical protein n=1 Tax=Psychrobacter sp. NG254 TaxID=2782003 RepID=UPI001889A002|nr:hypothetical protein [Psychrobacter sp. NG254]MBF2720603.1 hypothetical protein [Psychrobacter sp. NG254]
MKFFHIKILIIISLLTLSVSGRADVLGAGIAATGKVTSSIIANETVESLIESARRQAKVLIAESENSGNVLLTRGADELNLTADNIERIFQNQLKITFAEIDEDKRDLLIGLASATNVATELSDKAYTFKDTLTLDVRSILGEIPFVKENLVLQRISGLSVISGKEKFKLRIIGSYVGLPGESHSTSIEALLDGKNIENIEVDPREIHLVEILIPSVNLENHLLKDKPARIPLILKINQTFKKKLFGFLWNIDSRKSYEANLNLILYPSYAGDINVVARHEVLGWKKSQAIERDMTHSDHCSKNCKNHYGTSHEVNISVNGDSLTPLTGQKRIISSTCNLISGPSSHSIHEETSVSQDKATAKCRVRFRTQSQTYRLTAQIEEYGVIEEKDSSFPAKLSFDELTEVRIPKTTTEIFIQGKLITGDMINIIGSQTTSSGLVKIVRRLENANDKSVILTVSRPNDTL